MAATPPEDIVKRLDEFVEKFNDIANRLMTLQLGLRVLAEKHKGTPLADEINALLL